LQINYLAVVAAAVSAFVIGGLWYSPLLFHKPWLAANGFGEADVQKGSPAKIFGVSFLLTLVMAANLAAFLGRPDTTLAWGATAGALTGAGFLLPGIGVVALFERRPLGYTLINGGYWAVALTLMGAILGGWR
jgi:hypothetical protein